MRIMKKIAIMLMIIMLCMSFATVSIYASDWKDINQFDGEVNTDLNDKATKIVGAIVSVVRIVAVGVAIIMLAFVAMKYMSAAPGDRAEIKKHAVIYVVGALVLFGSSGILTIIQDFADNI